MAIKAQDSISNYGDYPLLREFQAQLLRNDPFSRYGVHAGGIGRKMVGGQATDRLALLFYVTCKVPLSKLPRERRIPRSFLAYSREGDREVELMTDVIESLPTEPAQDPEGVFRPVRGGVACDVMGEGGTTTSDLGGPGTIGGWVWDNTDDTIVMLSNQHVFGNEGNIVLQPGFFSPGVGPENRIGFVKRHMPISLTTNNLIDAAIAEADSSELFDLTVLNVGPAVYETADPQIDDEVEKMGRTTGHTVGVVVDTDHFFHTYLGTFHDAFRIAPQPSDQPFADLGDSGSLIFRRGGEGVIKPALGLLHGKGGEGFASGCKFRNIAVQLDVGPLCIAGCTAFLDALFGDGADADVGGVTADRSRTPDVSPPVFTSSERQRDRSRLFHSGFTSDLRKRLMTSQRGRGVVRFADRHPGELLTLVVKDGDTRRAMVAALRPLFVGVTTTTDVLERRLTEHDIQRLDKLAAVLARKGSGSLRRALKVLQGLMGGAAGRSLAEILRIPSVTYAPTEGG